MCPAFNVAVLRLDSGLISMFYICIHIHLPFCMYQILQNTINFKVKTRERQVLHELGIGYQSGNLS